jgi:type IV pilus assembly protein PilM
MNKAVPKATETACGNCGAGIDPNSQFCAGCGQPLWQTCECGGAALLTQSFCNGCGINLDEKLEAKLAGYERIFSHCHKLRDDGKYSDAIRVVEGACKSPDYRFKHVANQAQQLLAQVTAERDQWATEVEKSTSRVERYLAANRLDDIVRILSRIPRGMLTPELTTVLSECASKLATTEQCKSDLNAALAEKKYEEALGCMVQLAELNPTESKYEKRIEQLVVKVVEKAEKYRDDWRFQRVVELLQCIPDRYMDTKLLELLSQCEEAITLRQILAKSAYLNPLIVSALDKLAKLTQGDEAIAKLQLRLKETRAKLPKLKSEIWPEWMKPETGFLGLNIVPTRVPKAFPGNRPECITAQGGQFFVAIGLAAQAARNTMPKGEILCEKKQKKVLGFLGAKKLKPAELGWGIDIGSSSIKAVLLKYSGEPLLPHIEHAAMVKIDTQASSIRKVNKDAIESAVRKLLTEINLGSERVVVNFAGSDLVSRYLLLPPATDAKKFDDFVLQDARANIPINMELLQTAYHVSHRTLDDSISPSAILVAARKQEVDFRRALLESVGLRVDSFLAEPFAMWNALQTMESIDPAALFLDENASLDVERGQSLADMLIDVGMQRTTILISHPNGIWHRTLDWGTQDLTAAIAKTLQLTHSDADAIRRDASRAKHLQVPLDAMQTATFAPRREIERSAYAARDAIGNLRLRRAMLIGGGAYQPFLSSWFNNAAF